MPRRCCATAISSRHLVGDPGDTPDLIGQVLDLIEVLTEPAPAMKTSAPPAPGSAKTCPANRPISSSLTTSERFAPRAVSARWAPSAAGSSPRATAICCRRRARAFRLSDEHHRSGQSLRVGLPAGETERFQALAARLGAWPLLLKLVKGVLARRIAAPTSRCPSRWTMSTRPSRGRGLAAFDARDQGDRNRAVEEGALGLAWSC